jgi:hypothetical protein
MELDGSHFSMTAIDEEWRNAMKLSLDSTAKGGSNERTDI